MLTDAGVTGWQRIRWPNPPTRFLLRDFCTTKLFIIFLPPSWLLIFFN